MMTREQADDRYQIVMDQARRYVAAEPDTYDHRPAYHRIKGDLLAMAKTYLAEAKAGDLEAAVRYCEIVRHLPSPHNVAEIEPPKPENGKKTECGELQSFA